VVRVKKVFLVSQILQQIVTVYETAKIKCDFVNKGNKAGRLCVETLVKQSPSLRLSAKGRIYRSYNCSGTVNANDRRTVSISK
jgi:hypothetical protein